MRPAPRSRGPLDLTRPETLILSCAIPASRGAILRHDLRWPNAFQQFYRESQRGAWSTSALTRLMVHTASRPPRVGVAMRGTLRICQEDQS